MVISTYPSRRFAQKALKKFLLTILEVSLISIPTLAFALPVVNLTLDRGDMDEASLGTGKFTVTRSIDENFEQPLYVRFTYDGTATIGADYTATDLSYISPYNQRSMTIPANETSMSSIVTPVKDLIIEGDETVIWTLYSDDASYTIGTDILAEMTIADLIDLIFKDSMEDAEPGSR